MLLGNGSTQMAKEKRKKVTKDFNRDLILLAEDPEMFEEAALLLFGASFEKKMKDHLESLKCLRQSMAPKSGYHDIIYKTRVIPSAHPPAQRQILRQCGSYCVQFREVPLCSLIKWALAANTRRRKLDYSLKDKPVKTVSLTMSCKTI